MILGDWQSADAVGEGVCKKCEKIPDVSGLALKCVIVIVGILI